MKSLQCGEIRRRQAQPDFRGKVMLQRRRARPMAGSGLNNRTMNTGKIGTIKPGSDQNNKQE